MSKKIENLEKAKKIKVIFLSDLYKEKMNYFIDLKNIKKIKYHSLYGQKFKCGTLSYDGTELLNIDISPCLFCNQNIKSNFAIYADILIFDNKFNYDCSKVLYLSNSEYQMLLNQKKYLFLNGKNLSYDKIKDIIVKMKNNIDLYLMRYKSYFAGEKELRNISSKF